MSRLTMFVLFYMASFLQAGAYGLTFLLPRLFAQFGANEKIVGLMLSLTAISTLIAVYFSGHLTDKFGRLHVLGGACFAIAAALTLYGLSGDVGIELILASILLGAGWGLTYALAPIVLTGLVKPDERVRYFAILSVAIMAGFGLSPVLASFMEKAGFSIRDAFYLTAALCALAGMLFIGQSGMVSRYGVEAARQARSKLTLQSSMQILCSRARLPIIMVCIGASIFAGMNNFQTVFADARGLDYAGYFLAYTLTVVFFRAVLARFSGGARPYITIALLQYVMMGSVLLFIFSGSNVPLYLIVAFLFGIGYGVSYPILAAMAAQDAVPDLLPQTLLLFALSYFIGIFGFPLIAGWMIVELGSNALLILLAGLAFVEATMAFVRGRQPKDAADAALAS